MILPFLNDAVAPATSAGVTLAVIVLHRQTFYSVSEKQPGSNPNQERKESTVEGSGKFCDPDGEWDARRKIIPRPAGLRFRKTGGE